MAIQASPPALDPVSRELDAQLTRYAERVRHAARRYGLSGDDVDEVFQEVRIRVWQALRDSGNIAAVPASYIYRTALSAAIDLIRRRRARRDMAEDSDDAGDHAMLTGATTPDATLEEKNLTEAIEQEIRHLADDRAVAVRMHLEGYAREEIAMLLHWSEPRTRHLIYRGLAQLRERLRSRGIGPDLIE